MTRGRTKSVLPIRRSAKSGSARTSHSSSAYYRRCSTTSTGNIREFRFIPTPIAQNAQQYRDLRERKIDLLLGRMTLPIQEDIHAEILFHDSIKIVVSSDCR